MPNKTIVLASASPRRKQLLKRAIKNFEIVPSHVDESKITYNSPEGFAVKAALAKAEDVALGLVNCLVIGADTIVVLDNKILGKPKDEKHAIAMLKSLVGKTHRVITGIAVMDSDTGKILADFVETDVKMRNVPEQKILDYVKSRRPLDKAGSYGIQEIDSIFIDNIYGDYDNVVGLPIKKLKELLAKLS